MPEGKVLAFGCFDLLHPGHLFYLEKAKQLGSTKAEQLINEYCR
ncbi:MAG: adenylyltransferase/cytidyltransferase family protein [Candidatus Diapherotrites archaeon]